MKKSVQVLIALSIVFGCAAVSFGQEEVQSVGGYSKVDTNNADVVAAAEFAVSARKEKTGGPLSLVSIKRAEHQVVAGINYRLCLEVKAGDETDAGVESQDVQVVVWNKLTRRGEKKKYELTSWHEANCSKNNSEQNHYSPQAASVAGVYKIITSSLWSRSAEATAALSLSSRADSLLSFAGRLPHSTKWNDFLLL